MSKISRNIATVLLWLQRLLIAAVLILIGLEIYNRALSSILHGNHYLTAFIVIWLFTSYFVLPQIHRILTKFYLPEYFIGRVRTADGLLGDPVNLGFNGTKEQLEVIFARAGWVEADPLNFRNSWHLVINFILRRSYPSAPVSSLFLFGNRQNITFQMEVNNNPKARHHVRFWKTPGHWWLPGGTRVDWLGAATFDRRVGLSLFTGQITHKIAENTDDERDFTWQSLPKRNVSITKLPHFMSAYRTRGGGGDYITTDGTLIIITSRAKS